MATEVIVSASLVPASELLSRTIFTISETLQAAKAVLIQNENFKKFSIYLEKISFILKALNISSSESLNNAIEVLNHEIRSAKQLIVDCSKRNKVYLLINCRGISKRLESSTREISRALGLIPLASLDVSQGISDEISKLCNSMLDAKYQAAVKEEEILEKIELGIQERNVGGSYVNNLLILIAEVIGVSTEPSVLKKEFEDLKSEVEDAKLRTDMEEALQMDQIIALLGKADATSSPRAKVVNYLNRRNSLGRQPFEPLQSFYCPLNHEVMVNPVETSSGQTFERSAIEKWYADGNQLCPVTGTLLDMSTLRPNKNLRQSIEEWMDRNTIITIASMKSTLQSSRDEDLIHSLGKLQDICIARELHREWVIMEDYVPILIERLGEKNHEIRKHVLVILYILAKDSDDNKERIANADAALESIVRSLARHNEEIKLALQLLLELSRNNVARDFIGRVQGCILLLVTSSSNDDSQVAKDAFELLENLSLLDQNVIQMARANYFRPLLHLLTSGPENVKMIMAETLSEIELTDHNKLSLFKDGALGPLLELLSHGDIEIKTVAVKALQNLSSIPQNALQMIREGASGPLFEVLYRHSLSLPTLREQVAATIMHLATSTTVQEADQLQVSLLESEEDIFKFFSLISLTGPDVQRSILQSFHAMCQSPFGLDIRTKLRQLSAVQVLVQLCELDNHSVRENAIKLFYCLTEDGDSSLFLEHVSQKCIQTLVKIIKTSNNVEEIAAAMGIICNLPEDTQMSDWLLQAGALEIIIAHLINRNNNSYEKQVIENAVGALCRFTVSTNQACQKRVAEADIIPVLVQFLIHGTALTKQNAAISLKQFSESSVCLSKPIKKSGFSYFCMATPETGCPVHLGICTVKSSFCLLEANAIQPLVKMLRDTDLRSCEASLDTLTTLIDGERLQNGTKLLAKADAITPIIRLLSSPNPRLQEKALLALERIFRLVEFKQSHGNLAQLPLVEIAQKGSSHMKSLAGKVLSHLNVLHEQSSYF
ncbi:U-box domain-containing protein 44-like [Malania oleifera]|uniref:U-box domain-containing protein 44-like n=1 Tax=Malania oleifera TaxID=397392 RepID=UPI0025AE2885|nr:U-box domain-containing protein 44-like [Malania oleifera]XP_057950813.1 U-box domain-containing protein 44-like [Malania oleifera]